MRQYDKEGWITQLQGRRVVGHYLVSSKGLLTTAGRSLSMRNPTVTQNQRHVHIVRASLVMTASLIDDAAADPRLGLATVRAFSVADSIGVAGSTATAPIDLMGTAVTPVFTGAVDASGSLSGGTIGTTDDPFIQLFGAQRAAAPTAVDAPVCFVRDWSAKYGPIRLVGNEGVIMQLITGVTSPGTCTFACEIEWLESEKQ